MANLVNNEAPIFIVQLDSYPAGRHIDGMGIINTNIRKSPEDRSNRTAKDISSTSGMSMEKCGPRSVEVSALSVVLRSYRNGGAAQQRALQCRLQHRES
jgi:hypothetical protein